MGDNRIDAPPRYDHIEKKEQRDCLIRSKLRCEVVNQVPVVIVVVSSFSFGTYYFACNFCTRLFRTIVNDGV